MADQITNYQCPSCLAPLRFDEQSQQLVCDYCGETFTTAQIEALYAEKDEAAAEAAQEWDTSELKEEWGEDADGMRVYNCPSCGAQLICDETTAASSCPYCGNPTIVPGQLHGALKPDCIIPFKLDKDEAVKALKKHYKGKKLLPRAFTDENHIEKLQGVYVPFWLFDGTAEANMQFHATRSETHREGSYEVTTTSHFNLQRNGTVELRSIPADGSSKMPDALMDSLEPYNYDDLVPFSNAYLPGFMADKYDVTAEDCFRRADARARRTVEDAMAATCVGYDTVTPAGGTSKLNRGGVRYALLPVWVLSTHWKDQNFLFAMNGQTGRLIGDLPTDKGQYWKWFFIAGSIVAAAVMAVSCFLL